MKTRRRPARGPRALAVALFLLAPMAARAAIVRVDILNDTGIEDGSAAHPYNTIQEGISHAGSGDRVLVAPGLYKETLLMKDGVSVQGAGARTTIIDGTGLQNSVVTFNGTRSSPILSGFTITGGAGDVAREVAGVPVRIGGGVLVLNSSPVITQNVITGNRIEDGYCLGGGIYVYSALSTPQILENVIALNRALSATVPGAGEGGGIYVVAKNGGVIISGNTVQLNEAATGGGILVQHIVAGAAQIDRNLIRGNAAAQGAGVLTHNPDGSGTTILNNLITGNASPAPGARGGGVRASAEGSGSFSIRSNTIAGNSVASDGGGLWLDDALSTASSVVANNILAGNGASQGGGIDHQLFHGTIRKNTLHANAGGDLSGGGSATLIDNALADPQFLALEPGSYQLAPGSPCIDTADAPSSPPGDIASFPRPFDGDFDLTARADRGAYEYPSGDVAGLQALSGGSIDWLALPGQESFNLYRGSLPRLAATGEHTQDPLVEPLAARICGLTPADLPWADPVALPPGGAVFYLATLVEDSWEGGLGETSLGLPRANLHPCP